MTLSEDIDTLEKVLYAAIDDIDDSNRTAVLDVLALLLPKESFKPIVEQAIQMLRVNLEEGGESQKKHVKYILDFILRDEHKSEIKYHDQPHNRS